MHKNIIMQNSNFKTTFQIAPTQLSVERIDIDFSTIAPKLREVAVNILNASVGDGLKNVASIFSGNLDRPEEQLQGLIYTAFSNAMFRITVSRFKTNWDKQNRTREAQVFEQDLYREILSVKFSIDKTFFETPRTHIHIKHFQDFFRDWLVELMPGLEKKHVENAISDFPSYFVYELACYPLEKYKAAYEHLQNNPFTDAFLKERAIIQNHEALICDFVEKAAFNDANIKLKDLYLPSRFLVHKECIEKNKDERNEHFEYSITDEDSTRSDEFQRYKANKDLTSFVTQWLNKTPCQGFDEKKSLGSILVLLGQPGQGKSSFCTYLAHNILVNEQEVNINIFKIRLRDLDEKDKFINDPLHTIIDYIRTKGDREFKQFSLDNGDFKNSLFLLDGLDEFYMNKNLGSQDIQRLFEQLETQLNKNPNDKIRCIITSRLNYFRPDTEASSRNIVTLRLDYLNEEEQNHWLDKYQNLAGEVNLKSKDLERFNKDKNLKYLVNQPILIQMVVASNIDISEVNGQVDIYKQLFDTLIKRSWEDKQLTAFEKLTTQKAEKAYRDFLQEIAYQIFISKNEYIRNRDFDDIDSLKRKKNKLTEALGTELGQAKDLVKNLLISFYFEPVKSEGRDKEEDNYAFEFLHKSLQEYLVAERYLELFVNVNKYEEDEDAFREIFKITSVRFLTSEIITYIEELAKRKYLENQELLQEAFVRLQKKYDYCLMERDFFDKALINDDKNARLSISEQGLACFYAYINVMVKMGKNFTTNFKLNSPRDVKEFWKNIDNVNFISEFNAQNTGVKLKSITPQNKIDLSFQNLKLLQISDSWGNVNFNNSAFKNMQNARFWNCFFDYSDFIMEYGSKKPISYMSITDLIFFRCSFINVIMGYQSIEYTVFSHCKFLNSNCKNAFKEHGSRDVKFEEGSIINCNFEEANLKGFVFSYTTIKNNNFTKTIIGKDTFKSISFNELREANPSIIKANGLEKALFKEGEYLKISLLENRQYHIEFDEEGYQKFKIEQVEEVDFEEES